MKIVAVDSRSDLKKFIEFPYQIHRHTANWIPPLRLDQYHLFNPKKNSMLQHCDYQCFLLYRQQQICGRVVAYINHVATDYWGEKVGFFGHYECSDDFDSSSLLLDTAANWLRARGARKMWGPWNFVSQDMGFICEGFDLPPIVLSSYNPPYYNDQMLRFGLHKIKDLLVYNCDSSKGYRIPERFLDFTDRIAERYRVTVRPINMKQLVADARIIVQLTNESIAGNWGFYPVAESEAEQIAADLKLIVHPELILIAEVDGQPIGYLLTLPDINVILRRLNGSLFPLGMVKLLRGIKKIRRYRIWALGLLPPYQKKGISVLMFRRLNDILANQNVYIEANWVLEDNALMNNALIQLQFELVKKYRIYELLLE